jgi:hypothetical protein
MRTGAGSCRGWMRSSLASKRALFLGGRGSGTRPSLESRRAERRAKNKVARAARRRNR